MASTIPSTTAWRARSWGVQWVMCNPSAMGSRQASSTTRALCRWGNLLRAPQARLVQQESFQSALLVTTADAPDRGPVTFQPAGDILDGLACRDGQDDTGML